MNQMPLCHVCVAVGTEFTPTNARATAGEGLQHVQVLCQHFCNFR